MRALRNRPFVTTFRPNLVLHAEPETDDPSDSRTRATRALADTRRRIALENRMAADAPGLAPDSPHLRLAGRVAAALEGATLPPERRAAIVDHARTLGVHEFDAQLVIAVIQDRVRRGQSLDDIIGPLEVLGRTAGTTRPPTFANLRIVVVGTALGLAIGGAMLLVRWLTGGG